MAGEVCALSSEKQSPLDDLASSHKVNIERVK